MISEAEECPFLGTRGLSLPPLAPDQPPAKSFVLFFVHSLTPQQRPDRFFKPNLSLTLPCKKSSLAEYKQSSQGTFAA